MRAGRSVRSSKRSAENASTRRSVASATNWLLRPPPVSLYSSSADVGAVRRIALDPGSFSMRQGNGAIAAGAGSAGVRAGAAVLVPDVLEVLEVLSAGGAVTTKFDTSHGIGGSPGAFGSRTSTRYAPGLSAASYRTSTFDVVTTAPAWISASSAPRGRVACAISRVL